MIIRTTDVPPHVVGFEVTGEVTMEQYKNIIVPEVERLALAAGELYFLFVLKTDLTNITAGAWWQDLKISVKHIRQWKKIAVVSDSKTIEKLTGLFAYVSPAKAKGFQLAQLEEAKQWVSEKI